MRALVLVSGVRWGQVGCIAGGGRNAETPNAGTGWVGGVGEGAGVVHVRVREPRRCKRRQGWERGALREQICT